MRSEEVIRNDGTFGGSDVAREIECWRWRRHPNSGEVLAAIC